MSSPQLPCSVCGAALPAPSWACARCGAFTAPPAEAPDKPTQLLTGCLQVPPLRVVGAMTLDATSIALLCLGASMAPNVGAGILWVTAAVMSALIIFSVRTTGRSPGLLILGIRLVSRETASAPGWAFSGLFAADVTHGRDPITAIFHPIDLTADAPGWDDTATNTPRRVRPPVQESTRWAPHHAQTPPPPPTSSASAAFSHLSALAVAPHHNATAQEQHVTTASLSSPTTPHDGIGPLKGGAAATTQLMPLPPLRRATTAHRAMNHEQPRTSAAPPHTTQYPPLSALSPADDDTHATTRATHRHTTALVLDVDGSHRVPVAPRMVIGRDPETQDDQTPVTIPDLARQVSRSHAHLEQHPDGTVHVTDLGSLNGTHIDNEHGLQRIPSNTTVIVEPGSTLVIGDHRLTLTPRIPAPAAFAIR